MGIITYTPVAGLTIKEALKRGVQLATTQNAHVLIVINDIVMFVNKRTNVDQALKDYKQKLDLRYYSEQIRKTNTK